MLLPDSGCRSFEFLQLQAWEPLATAHRAFTQEGLRGATVRGATGYACPCCPCIGNLAAFRVAASQELRRRRLLELPEVISSAQRPH